MEILARWVTTVTMPDIRETYDLPRRVPVPMRQWALMVGVIVIALGLWAVLPDSPILVAVLVIVILGVVFAGVRSVLASRQLHEAPGRNPTPPPSTQ